MEYRYIKVETEERLAIITLNRPEVRNALSRALMEELGQALDAVEAEEAIRVIIVTGAGDRAFAAGADISELRQRTSLSEIGPINRHRRGVLLRLENMYKPTIAAINGFAAGGGCEIALACTLRIAADGALMGLPEINLGIIPGLGGTQRLARLAGEGRAMELILTGDLIDAREAYRIGLVNKVVPPTELMNEARALGKKLAEKAPIALRLAKDTVHHGLDMPLSAALEFENRVFALICGTEDKVEGVAAFLEKRTPTWRGR